MPCCVEQTAIPGSTSRRLVCAIPARLACCHAHRPALPYRVRAAIHCRRRMVNVCCSEKFLAIRIRSCVCLVFTILGLMLSSRIWRTQAFMEPVPLVVIRTVVIVRRAPPDAAAACRPRRASCARPALSCWTAACAHDTLAPVLSGAKRVRTRFPAQFAAPDSSWTPADTVC